MATMMMRTWTVVSGALGSAVVLPANPRRKRLIMSATGTANQNIWVNFGEIASEDLGILVSGLIPVTIDINDVGIDITKEVQAFGAAAYQFSIVEVTTD